MVAGSETNLWITNCDDVISWHPELKFAFIINKLEIFKTGL